MVIVDSGRLAALFLGYYGRFLRAIQESVYEGDNHDEKAIGVCLRPLREAAFVLAKGVSVVENQQFGETLSTLLARYGEAVMSGPKYGPIYTVKQRDEWGKLQMLSGRLVAGSEILKNWYAVGHALADFICRLLAKRNDEQVSDDEWILLMDAIESLPADDREVAENAIPKNYSDAEDLFYRLRASFDELKSELPTLDRRSIPAHKADFQPANPSPATPNEGRRKKRQSSTNDDRDEYIYNEYIKGTSLIKIRTEVEKPEEWSSLYTDPAVTRAAQRFAERKGLTKPKHGQG